MKASINSKVSIECDKSIYTETIRCAYRHIQWGLSEKTKDVLRAGSIVYNTADALINKHTLNI